MVEGTTLEETLVEVMEIPRRGSERDFVARLDAVAEQMVDAEKAGNATAVAEPQKQAFPFAEDLTLEVRDQLSLLRDSERLVTS